MVKESTGDIQRMHRLYQATGGKVAIFNGCNPLALEVLVAGAIGWCTSAPNLIPELNLALWDAVQNGDLEEARTLFYRQYELLDYITLFHRKCPPNTPCVVKRGVHLWGNCLCEFPRTRLSLCKGVNGFEVAESKWPTMISQSPLT